MGYPPILRAMLDDRRLLAAVLGPLIIFILFLEANDTVLMPGPKAYRRKGPATALLIGPSDAGKTAIFAKLVYGTYPQTHTSIETSDSTFKVSLPDVGWNDVRIVDIPGHPRLKDEIKKYISTAEAVIFVVDIVNLVRNAGPIAEQLPPILSALANRAARADPFHPEPRVFILAHKTDLLIRPAPPSIPSPPNIPSSTRAVAYERLLSILTREMDRLKSARANTAGGRIEGMSKVATSGGGWLSRLFGGRSSTAATEGETEMEDDENLIWGSKGPFIWEDVEGVRVEFGCSALGMVDVNQTGNSNSKDPEQQEVPSGNGLEEVKSFLLDL